ncbi:MAG: VOC family protein, partial [Acetanaerobacterium sp.]
GIGHLAITVKDMEKSLDFYTRVLGFERAFDIDNPENGEPWIVYVNMGNGQFIELFYGGTIDTPWNGRLRGFNHICFVVDDIQKIAKQIEGAGYKLDKQPKFGCDNNWQCWVTDPDGIRVEMMQLGDDSPQKLASMKNK